MIPLSNFDPLAPPPCDAALKNTKSGFPPSEALSVTVAGDLSLLTKSLSAQWKNKCWLGLAFGSMVALSAGTLNSSVSTLLKVYWFIWRSRFQKGVGGEAFHLVTYSPDGHLVKTEPDPIQEPGASTGWSRWASGGPKLEKIVLLFFPKTLSGSWIGISTHGT